MKRNKFEKSKLMKTAAVFGMVSTVLTIAATVLSGCFFVKLFRYIDTAQRVLPEMERAARLYSKNNGGTETNSATQNESSQEPQESDSE